MTSVVVRPLGLSRNACHATLLPLGKNYLSPDKTRLQWSEFGKVKEILSVHFKMVDWQLEPKTFAVFG